MYGKTILGIVAASMLFAGAASAESGQREIRISTANKAAADLRTEIKVAATTVCKGYGIGCTERATLDANQQLARMQRGRVTAQPQERPTTIRISTVGKSVAQLRTEIRAAAEQVCANTNLGPSATQACVTRAVSVAGGQLGKLRQASADETASLY